MRQGYIAALRAVLISLFIYSLAGAQSESVKINVEKASYEVGDAIVAKVANGNDREITTWDHKSSCSIVDIERQQDKEWTLAGLPCRLRNLPMQVNIGPRQEISVRLSTIDNFGSVRSFKPGTYRIKFDYFFENSPNNLITVYSDSFQVTADAISKLSSCLYPIPLLKNESSTPGYIVYYDFGRLMRLGAKPEEVTQLLMSKYNFTPGQVFHNLPDLFSGFFAELSEETLAEIRCESIVKLVEQNTVGKVEELTKRQASRKIGTIPAVPAQSTGPLPNTKPKN